MKNIRKSIILLLVLLFSFPILFSCKKGDGDPFFSIYSRKQRLTGDWNVTSIAETVKYKSTTITTTYNGSRKKVEMVVRDTIVYTATDTLYVYSKLRTAVGSLYYNFGKTGTYQIDEAFTDDTTHAQYTSQEKGLWYFTGGGRDSDTKPGELLGLQATSFVQNSLTPALNFTESYSGQNTMGIYHIFELASKEIELHADVEETTNLFTVKTNLKIILKPK
jgi:hypothetical protein